MIRAYTKSKLSKAQAQLALMMNYLVINCNYSLNDAFNLFIDSSFCKQIESGNRFLIYGRSGSELAMMILDEKNIAYTDHDNYYDKGQVYWAAFSLSYFQWYTALTFKEIIEVIPFDKIFDMYHPYHEMDIMQFVDTVNDIYFQKRQTTNLKQKRLEAGLSQSELSKLSGVPVRTIQQYEQKQKNINHARADYVVRISRVLYCRPEDLLEVDEFHYISESISENDAGS